MSDVGYGDQMADTAGLRVQIVEAAGHLGWGSVSVSRFARALTGKRWEECGEAELREMLEEYEVLIDVIEAKRARAGRISSCS